jgi:hypothetical protein
MSTATQDCTEAAPFVPPARPTHTASPVQQALTLTWRTVVKIKHVPEQLLDVTLQPMIFILLFVFVLGGGLFGNWHDALQYMLPGILVQTVVFATMGIGQVHLAQRRGRVDAQLVGQRPADPLVRRERVGLPPGAVERGDELAVQPLPHRVRGGQRLRLGDHPGVPAQRQVGGQPVLGGGQPQLLQPAGRRGGERGVGHVGQRRPAPEAQRAGQALGGRLRLARGQRLPAPLGQPLELLRVDLRRVQPVSRGQRLDRRAGVGERAAQPGHQRLQGVDRAGGWLVAPQPVDQGLDADHGVGRQREPGQQRAQPGAAHLDRPAPRVPRLEGAEHRYAHVPIIGPPRPGAPERPGSRLGGALVPVM